MRNLIPIITILAIGLVGGHVVEASMAGKPNIITILIDDLGWAELGFRRPEDKEVITPNIDSLLNESVLFERAYSFKFCSPTRSAFMSGRNPVHVNVQNFAMTQYNPDDPLRGMAGAAVNFTFFARRLSEVGYASHFVGKFDTGMAYWRQTPKGRGYEASSLGFFAHMVDGWNMGVGKCGDTWMVDFWGHGFGDVEGPRPELRNPRHCFVQNMTSPENPVAPFPTNETGCKLVDEVFLDRVLKIVSTHPTSTPLHLTWTPHLVHTPLEMRKSWEEKFAFIPDPFRKTYHAMTSFVDAQIGALIASLKARGMWENTLLTIQSDNGGPIYDKGWGGGNNFPLRGGKASNFEGGIRVGSIWSGGLIPEAQRGTKRVGLAAAWDFYASIADVAGFDPTDHEAAAAGLPPIDSISMWDYVTGKNMTPPRTQLPIGSTTAYHDEWGTSGTTQVQGMIVHDTKANTMYKLLVRDTPMDVWTGPQWPNASTSGQFQNDWADCGETGCLFELFSDPTEHIDLAKSHPDILAQLHATLQLANATVFSPNRTSSNDLACQAATTKYNNYWGPFVEG